MTSPILNATQLVLGGVTFAAIIIGLPHIVAAVAIGTGVAP